MRPRPLRRLNDQVLPPAAAGVYGSLIPSQFLRDLIAGRNSLDIITLGDSNAMRSDYGYTAGWHRALGYFGAVNVYASPLFAGNLYLNGAPSGTTRTDQAWGSGIGQAWVGDNTTDRVGTYRHLVFAAAASDANAVALKNFLGFDSTNYTDDNTTRLPRSQGWQWVGAFVPQTVSGNQNYYSSFASANYININSTSQLNYGGGSGASNLQYRVVYGTFGTGTGQFTLGVRDVSSPNTTTYDPNGAVSTSSAVGYATRAMNFTTQATTLNSVRCYWDGFSATQSLQAKGPVAILWQSVIRQSGLGYAVSSLIGHSGLDTSGVADRIEWMDKLLDCYLKEIIDRQMQAGGSGRAIIFLNSGINDVSPSTTWTPAAARIVQRIQQRWVIAGGSLANLAFVFTITHATTAQGTWDTNRAATSTAANAWGAANTASNVCVVDLAQNYPGQKMLNGVPGAGGSLYDGAGSAQAHLSTALTQLNGYDAMVGNVVSSLISCA